MDMQPQDIPPAAAPSEADRLVAEGDRLRDQRAWADAAEAYGQYLRLCGEDGAIWIQYGHCLKEWGDPKGALLCYREAEKLRPEDGDLQLQIGHALKLLGRAEEALGAYAMALSLEPGNVHARRELLGGDAPVADAARRRRRPHRRRSPRAAPLEAAASPRPTCRWSSTPPTCSIISATTGRRPASSASSSTSSGRRCRRRHRGRRAGVAVAAFEPAAAPGSRCRRRCSASSAASPPPAPTPPSRPGPPRWPRWPRRCGRGPALDFAPGQHAGQSRHLLVDPRLPAAGAGGQGAARHPLHPLPARLHPAAGAGALRRGAGRRIRPLVRRRSACMPMPCWRIPTARGTISSGCSGPCCPAWRSLASPCRWTRRLTPWSPRRCRPACATAGLSCCSSAPSNCARTTCWSSRPG